MSPSANETKHYTTNPLFYTPNLTPLPFIPASSREVTHKCSPFPTCPSTSPPFPTKPLTTLLSSVPLAKKIQYLIESLECSWRAGCLPQAEVERRMLVLVEQYVGLREEVECELESARINSRFFSSDVSTFPASGNIAEITSTRPIVPPSSIFYPSLKTDNEVKRKREVGGYGNTDGPVEKRFKTKSTPAPIQTSVESDQSYSDDSGVVFAQPASPVGSRTCMIPFTAWEGNRMGDFDWRVAGERVVGVRGRKLFMEGCVSPRGGVY